MQAFYYIFLICTANLVFSRPARKHYRVLMVPGFGGSQLFVNKTSHHLEKAKCKKDRYKVWVSEIDIVQGNCLDDLLMRFDKDEKKFVDIDGVSLYAKEMGNLETVKELGSFLTSFFTTATVYYAELIKYLSKSKLLPNYRDEENIFGAPYDFRKIVLRNSTMREYFDSMSDFIEEQNFKKKEKFVLIAHSLGCLLSARFLQTKSKIWIEENIAGVFLINGAYQSSAGSLNSILDGEVNDALEYFQDKNFLKKMVTSFPSMYALLKQPNMDVWHGCKNDTVLASFNNKNYTLHEIEQLLTDLNLFDDLSKLKSVESPLSAFPEDLRIHVVNSFNVSTVSRLELKMNDHFLEVVPSKHVGDGTILEEDLNLVDYLVPKNADKSKRFTKSQIAETGHLSIVHSEKLFLELQNFIMEL